MCQKRTEQSYPTELPVTCSTFLRYLMCFIRAVLFWIFRVIYERNGASDILCSDHFLFLFFRYILVYLLYIGRNQQSG